MADNALADCITRIYVGEPREAAPLLRPTVRKTALPTVPEPLRNYVDSDLDEVRWSAVGGGVRQKVLSAPSDRSAICRLLYIPAGQAVPEHGHRGLELTLVLAGSFLDGEVIFTRGDLEIADDALEHTPIAGAEAPCICLAVTDAPLRFKSWLPRLVQAFVGI